MKYCFFRVLALSLSELWSQEVIPVAGCSLGDGGLVSFMVGQVFYQHQTGSKGAVLEGFSISLTILRDQGTQMKAPSAWNSNGNGSTPVAFQHYREAFAVTLKVSATLDSAATGGALLRVLQISRGTGYCIIVLMM